MIFDSETPDPAKVDYSHSEHGLREESDRVGAVVAAPTPTPTTTLESFAHLDEKKILRKVGLIPWGCSI